MVRQMPRVLRNERVVSARKVNLYIQLQWYADSSQRRWIDAIIVLRWAINYRQYSIKIPVVDKHLFIVLRKELLQQLKENDLYLGSVGTKVIFWPRLAQIEYSYATALVSSLASEESLAVVLSRTPILLSSTSTTKLSGNSWPLSEVRSMFIFPFNRYFSPLRMTGYKKKKLENVKRKKTYSE